MGTHHFETSTTASWRRSLDRKRPLGYHSNSYSWKGKERTPPFGQTALVCTGKQTNLGFSEGILPRQLQFSFFDGEVNVNFEWSTLCALGRRTISADQSSTSRTRKIATNVEWLRETENYAWIRRKDATGRVAQLPCCYLLTAHLTEEQQSIAYNYRKLFVCLFWTFRYWKGFSGPTGGW